MASFQKRLWYVQEFSGSALVRSFRLPIKTSGKQIQILLQRLASRHLSPEQLVSLALQSRRSDALCPRVRDRSAISLEVDCYRYVAQIVSEFQLAEMTAPTSALRFGGFDEQAQPYRPRRPALHRDVAFQVV